MADLFKTSQKGQPESSRSRRKARTQREIQELKQTVVVTTKVTRPFAFEQPAAPGEETGRKITLAATSQFGRPELYVGIGEVLSIGELLPHEVILTGYY